MTYLSLETARSLMSRTVPVLDKCAYEEIGTVAPCHQRIETIWKTSADSRIGLRGQLTKALSCEENWH